MIIVHAGHPIDETERDGQRFPPHRIGSVYRRIYLHLLERQPTAVVSAAAGGADLIALRAAEDLFIPFHVLLPIPDPEFRHQAVGRGGSDWVEAYERALGNAASVTVADGLEQYDDWYLRGNDAILDHARSNLCSNPPPTTDNVEALAVVCSEPSDTDATSDFVAKASTRGLRVVTIDPMHD